MWEATKPPQSAIGKLWGEDWTNNPVPVPTTLDEAIIKTNEWTGRLNRATDNSQFAVGWQASRNAADRARDASRSGFDPTNGSVWFVALGRTRDMVAGEAQAEFEQRFWNDYNREVAKFSAYTAQNPGSAWTITPPENIVVLGNGAQMIAIITGTDPCTYTMSCNP
jgi:hypothetical protein